MPLTNVRFEPEGALATLTVDRVRALNALDRTTLDEIEACVLEAARERAIRCLIITGAGDKAFVAGADIAAMAEMSALEGREFSRRGQEVFRRLEQLPIPVLAAVNGFALGGGLELALACDFIFASTQARFGQPEINLGIIPGFGGTQRLARRIGLARARELIYSGMVIDAQEAMRIGLANRLFPPETLLEETRGFGRQLAEKAPVALRQAKAAMNAGIDLDLENGGRYESEAFAVAFGTADRGEGLRAFLEKRAPNYKGL